MEGGGEETEIGSLLVFFFGGGRRLLENQARVSSAVQGVKTSLSRSYGPELALWPGPRAL